MAPQPPPSRRPNAGRGRGGAGGRGRGGGRNGGALKILECANCHAGSNGGSVQVYDGDKYTRGTGSGPLMLKLCSKCRTVAYCCKKCEESHTVTHKKQCKPKQNMSKNKNKNKGDGTAKNRQKGRNAAQEFDSSDADSFSGGSISAEEWKPVGTTKMASRPQTVADMNNVPPSQEKAKRNYTGAYQVLLDADDDDEEKATTSHRKKAEASRRSKTKSAGKKSASAKAQAYSKLAKALATPDKPVDSAATKAARNRQSNHDNRGQPVSDQKGATKLNKPVAGPPKKDTASSQTTIAEYSKFAKALAQPEKSNKKKISSLKNLPKPRTAARTMLGHKPPDMNVLAKAMYQDVVLHVDLRCLPSPLHPFLPLHVNFMGVYEPQETDKNGFPAYRLNVAKSSLLLQRFRSLDPETLNMLAGHGIFFEGMRFEQGAVLCRFEHAGEKLWRAFHYDSMVLGAPNAPVLTVCHDLREQELDFWTQSDSLFERSSDAFAPWVTVQGHPVVAAMTPLKMFYRAMELAGSSNALLQPSKATDFSFWNRPLVVHAHNRKCSALLDGLRPWMGVYVPEGVTHDGYPVWRRSSERSNNLAASINEKPQRSEGLGRLGIDLRRCTDAPPACLYMHRHVLHLARWESFRSNPAGGFSLRGDGKPSCEERLLSESDALFQLGEAAFAKWMFAAKSELREVSICVTPEEYFKNTMNLADLELGILEGPAGRDSKKNVPESEEDEEEGSGRKKKKKKKKKSNAAENIEKATPLNEDLESPAPEDGANSDPDKEKLRPEHGYNGVKVSGQQSGKHPPNECCRRPATKEECIDDEVTPKTCTEDLTEKAKAQYMRLLAALDSDKAVEDCPSGSSSNTPRTPLNGEDLTNFFNLNEEEPLCFLVEEKEAGSVFEASMRSDSSVVIDETKQSLLSLVDKLLLCSIDRGWKQFAVTILRAGAVVTASTLLAAFKSFPQRNDEYNNQFARAITKIKLESAKDSRPLLAAVNKRVGRKTRKEFSTILKRAETEMIESREPSSQKLGLDPETSCDATNNDPASAADKLGGEDNKGQPVASDDKFVQANALIAQFKDRIGSSLEWYKQLLNNYREGSAADESDLDTLVTKSDESLPPNNQNESRLNSVENQMMSSADVAREMARFVHLPEDQQESHLNEIEKRIDLSDWDDESEWTVEMTEQAHKWFQRHLKRQHYLCERVIRRLQLLSTGRWTYVLCKPLKTRQSSVKLYESKIDKACRIIWEVAIAFSPRRSRKDFSCCEQVIRVWDIVVDHGNLTRIIDRAVTRIEASNQRGQQCMLYSELEGYDVATLDFFVSPESNSQRLPRVFAMRQEVEMKINEKVENDGVDASKTRHYPPASDDPQQYTLLKFYELDSGAIKLLLDGDNENQDLPFTPGPKEHEIIHHSSNPQRSILLMGRSGTGKTTCLVFRMWAQFMAYEAVGTKPRQLFVTKNDVLRREVEKSFKNMGLAWKRKKPPSESQQEEPGQQDISASGQRNLFPMFLTSKEWLEVLDNELPGERFFTQKELEERMSRKDDDAVKRGVEAYFAEGDHLSTQTKSREIVRKEFTFDIFRRKWQKLSARSRSNHTSSCSSAKVLDPALVWREIQSYIKGSVQSLRVGEADRSTRQNRFLRREDYLGLSRKVSRLDQTQRQIVYSVYEAYEKVKMEGNYFDEMDVVYNLAGRIAPFRSSIEGSDDGPNQAGLLPIDSLWVDEVQDFTQAELYLLTKLSSDPNNLMLAGDTAQSIAVGVGFRFTDVRQIFYEEFGGNEPHLLQLTHNYRSHAGVLRLAACVVELLYFFFRDSLDRLPPDLGLFDGPRPVIMEAQSPEELVLMLDGSKRETSRIEFGAHQVVIVRSEEAKLTLPDEFGVDKDWVMTVLEAKGLEFDDVLLYNFFTDSPAGDMWRIVSNYSEEDIAEYYEHNSVKSSGVQSYSWNGLLKSETRQLDFSTEQHKILETELKMLYTAITRARVNLFFAESDTDLSLPMFEYFTRRQVVDVASMKTNADMSAVRIFGKMDRVEDYLQRGEYYMQKAEGDRRKGCLRLAAKCFEKAGDMKRRDHARAYLSFVEIEEQELTKTKRRDKYVAERQRRLYEIAAQLLDAKDTVFLDKAAYCLLKVGDAEAFRSAEMFEMYAEICFARRKASPSDQKTAPEYRVDQQYFSYAAKIMELAASKPNTVLHDRRDLLVRSFRNYLCACTKEDLEAAVELLQENSNFLRHSFKELASLCSTSQMEHKDPLHIFRSESQETASCRAVKEALTKLARVSCLSYYAEDDRAGMMVALDAIPSKERVYMLSRLDADPVRFILDSPWASHSVYSKMQPARADVKKRSRIDITSMIVKTYSDNEQTEKASEILEERGMLLEASDLLQTLSQSTSPAREQKRHLVKSMVLKAQYVDLVLRCPGWEKHKAKLSQVLDSISSQSEVSESVHAMLALARAKIAADFTPDAFETCKKSVLWGHDAMQMILSSTKGPGFLFQKSAWTGTMIVDEIVKTMRKAAVAISRSSSKRNATDLALIKQVDDYFEIKQHHFDPSKLTTALVTNLKLRQALKPKDETALDQLIGPESSLGLVVQIDRDEVHAVLSLYLYHRAWALLSNLEKLLAEQATKSKPCSSMVLGVKCTDRNQCKKIHSSLIKATQDDAKVLQCRLFCLETMREIRREADCMFPGSKVGQSRYHTWKADLKSVSEELATIILESNPMTFLVLNNSEENPRADALVFRKSILQWLRVNEQYRWRNLSGFRKKVGLMEVVRFCRMMRFCGVAGRASQEVEKELGWIEKSQGVKADFSKGDLDPFLEGSNTPKDAKLFSRMWIWAVDNAEEDLFKSLSIVEDLITRTSSLDGLWTLARKDLLNLLEVNAIAIFCTLSLRYSQGAQKAPGILDFLSSGGNQAKSNAQQCWCLIPKKQYFKCLLNGDGDVSSRGFGIAVKDVAMKTCDTNFFDFFMKNVGHLEFLAGTIVGGELLKPPKGDKPEDIPRFERAICMSFFVCSNAVIFALAGQNISPHEARDDLDILPSVPLSGNIRTLVGQLKAAVVGCKVSMRLEQCFSSLTEFSTFLDLFKAVNNMLKNSGWHDEFISFRMRSNKGKTEVEATNISRIESVLRGVPFDERKRVFLEDYKPKCHGFLSQIQNTKEMMPSQQDLSRKSDEREAAQTILRYLRSWQKHLNAVDDMILYFRVKKRILYRFVAKIKLWLERIREESDVLLEKESKGNLDATRCPLNAIQDFFNDENYFQKISLKWGNILQSHRPFFDGIECLFCLLCGNQQMQADRMMWCQSHFPGLSYSDAALQYNRMRFGGDDAPFDEAIPGLMTFSNHVYEGYHYQKVQIEEQHHLALRHLATQLDLSFMSVNATISCCESQKGDGQYASWYLNVGEEARSLRVDLESSRIRFFKEAVPWPPPKDTQVLLASLHATCRRIQEFFFRVRDEELSRAQNAEADDTESVFDPLAKLVNN